MLGQSGPGLGFETPSFCDVRRRIDSCTLPFSTRIVREIDNNIEEMRDIF